MSKVDYKLLTLDITPYGLDDIHIAIKGINDKVQKKRYVFSA